MKVQFAEQIMLKLEGSILIIVRSLQKSYSYYTSTALLIIHLHVMSMLL